ncbi:enoyl-CoA hydratase/isomerase family protein [Alteromonas sp. 1_MG-2023]|uniref:enoyl-CoA hydratase/isomerase family protein n=1 Tax=Alteromonas sp. 1_MG-2023 TaxID=3062669 RepID=UPI0026E1EAB3|nr:enoyl-CoA hydratase/isomerase family protein [Alteromonas sp. 1_MG-2023]MDO6565947.1 enoyl-CoA hydratase/isomerase family protein [Alteromonas sp. 1_MG-2023]
MENKDSVVIVEEVSTASGHKVGVLTLNKPKALNALDLNMASLLLDALQAWDNRDDLVCVVLKAAGEKAFCAGGDIVSMYNAMLESDGEIPDFLATFFRTEYTLDYTIHHYPKPIIVWGSGIVMGGGMGLICGASHRVVTETSRLAMPEITIGLYPDVGGSYFLPRLPGKTGLYLGLTGAQMNGEDACYVELADVLLASDQQPAMFEALQAHPWKTEEDSDLATQVTQILTGLNAPESNLPKNVESHRGLIDKWCAPSNVADVVNNVLTTDVSEDKWLSRAQSTLAKGSPITAHLVFKQCERGAQLSLADCFRMEAIMSCRCGQYGEFQEGVRALLIEKDLSPNWKFKKVEDVPKEVVASFFDSPWSENDHPLAEL